MSSSLWSLKSYKNFLSLYKQTNRISRLSLLKRNMSSRKSCKPTNPCKPKDCKTSKSCEEGTSRTSRVCEPSDKCRPPNLCSQSTDTWKAPKCCNSSNPQSQIIPCRQAKSYAAAASCKETSSYPNKPWPLTRPTTWSPTMYMSSSCNPENPCGKSDSSSSSSKPSCPPICEYEEPCKKSTPTSCESPVDPCKSPCQSSDSYKSDQDQLKSSPCPIDPCDCSTCPTYPPISNPNILTQERCQSIRDPCPCEPMPICDNSEAARKLRTWKLITLCLLPIIGLTAGITHIGAEEDANKPRPEFIPYDYMYIRTKRFPWGDGNHTLFHNPIKNAVPPNGYEVEDPNAVMTETTE